MASLLSTHSSTSEIPTPSCEWEALSARDSQTPMSGYLYTRNLEILSGSSHFSLPISKNAHSCLSPLWDTFVGPVLEKSAAENDTSVSLMPRPEILGVFLRFLVEQFEALKCHDFLIHQGHINEVLDAVDTDVIASGDIHSVVLALDISTERQQAVLAAYFTAINYANRDIKVNESFLLQQMKLGTSRVYSMFAGQGSTNGESLDNFRDLWRVYKPLLKELVHSADVLLYELSKSGDSMDYFDNGGLRIREWLDNDTTPLSSEYIASAPVSFPLIGLISLSNFCIMCKTTNQTPGDAISLWKAVTGHSQGIVVAACIAKSKTWDDFYKNSLLCVEILFRIGCESQRNAPGNDLSSRHIQDCVEKGEGLPSHMLSVRGLSRNRVEAIITSASEGLAENARVYLALVNSRDNVVLAGPPKSLRGIALHVRGLKAAKGHDQSKIPYNKRRLEIFAQFLPISAPFHSPHLTEATQRILDRLRSCSIKGKELGTAVISTSTGSDLRNEGDFNIIPDLVRMVTCQLVDWPTASMLHGATHILDFGPGRFSILMNQMKDGTGARVIAAGALDSPGSGVGSKVELFDTQMPSSSKSRHDWEAEFGPKLRKTSSGGTLVDTKFSKVLTMPPLMVAGMTPTTVPWDFVASVSKAGFHIELAAGGYFDPESLRQAIVNVTSNIPTGRGVTVNLIYVNPRAIAWQVPLIRQLVQEGVPIDGITIGAGVPSPDVSHEYITTIGLKHIGFKPGSQESIRQVIDIADAHPEFPIILQWTGGRGGGHHSFEDFHTPILQMYGRIRRCSNIILVAGSGFGDSENSYCYLTGEWAKDFGYPSMPFDAILLGSRMMVAKEAHTSIQAKATIVEAKGVADVDWTSSYDRATGGVITVLSEMGQPIHKIATRGVLFWAELDKLIFSLNGTKRIAALEKNKNYIIQKLNSDFQKVWFPKTASGVATDLEGMTYYEVLLRMVEIMYIKDQSRWINQSYKVIILDFVSRIQERFSCNDDNRDWDLERPLVFLDKVLQIIPQCEEQLLNPQDVMYFLDICKRPARKPVNFVPRLDENFELWFKKDSLWQAEDVDAVAGRDVGRVCILQGPMAARYSTKVDEPAIDILNNIHEAYVRRLGNSRLARRDLDLKEDFEETPMLAPDLTNTVFEVQGKRMRFTLGEKGNLPEPLEWFSLIAGKTSGWIRDVLRVDVILQHRTKIPNPIRQFLRPRHGIVLDIDDFDQPNESVISLRIPTEHCHPNPPTVVMSCKDGIRLNINLFEYRKHGKRPATLHLIFENDPSNERFPIREIMEHRNTRVQEFYSVLWFDKPIWEVADVTLKSSFVGSPLTLTDHLILRFTHALKGQNKGLGSMIDPQATIPMDIAILAAWEVLMKPLLCPDVDGDLLQLVHKSNGFKYIPEARALKSGDVLQSTSRITGLYIENSGKVVDVSAVIKRSGRPIMEVTSSFLFQGKYRDFRNTFKIVNEPTMSLDVCSAKLQALLRSREWFILDDDFKDLAGEQLLIEAETQTTYARKNQISSLETSGRILSISAQGRQRKIGSVAFVAGQCAGNPVMDFLGRSGLPVDEIIKLGNPGSATGKATPTFKTPQNNELYARTSGDYNPIHVSDLFAVYANLKGPITHGMYTSAAVRNIVERWEGGGDVQRFRRYSASFTGMLFPGDQVEVEMSHIGMIHGRKVIDITATKKSSGDVVLKAEAEIEEPRTAYIFTGQGSQVKGMGLELYASSAVVREIWDKADKHMVERYGWSLLDIIKNNPKSLTVHFGGQRGRQIRSNYLSMALEHVDAAGKTFMEPIIRDMKPNASSYTFVSPKGLLFLTQFAQPALTLVEKAMFEELRSKGLVQQGARFAGHSLGEYGALGSLSDFMSIETLISVAFHRGLTMASLMDRDEHGRTDFSMMAVNPSRVMKDFNESALKNVVDAIAVQSKLLLEIVNFNVEGQQYVCAGHLRNLHALSAVLDHISRTKPSPSVFETCSIKSPDQSGLLATIHQVVLDSQSLQHPISLTRGIATVPLDGIDIPFHSRLLWPGVGAFRRFLNAQISESDVLPEKIVGQYIPNLTARPFELTREYVAETMELTGSPVLRELLDQWNGKMEVILD